MSETGDLKRKDPDSVVDFGVDWTDYLGGEDTIAESTWLVPAGLNEVSNSHSAAQAFVWLSGGTVGNTYAVVNRITTAGGRIEDETITILIEER